MEIGLAQAMQDHLRPLARRQHVRRERGRSTVKYKIPAYLPERFIEALRPNVSAAVDEIMTLPRRYWVRGRVDWSRYAPTFGRPRKTTLTLSRRYRPGDVSRAVAGYLMAMLKNRNLQ